MTTLHCRDQWGDPIGTSEVELSEDIYQVVIDTTFERRYVVDVQRRPQPFCLHCASTECEHVEQATQVISDIE